MNKLKILTGEEMAKYITNPEVKAMLLGAPPSKEQVDAQTELFRQAIAKAQKDDDDKDEDLK